MNFASLRDTFNLARAVITLYLENQALSKLARSLEDAAAVAEAAGEEYRKLYQITLSEKEIVVTALNREIKARDELAVALSAARAAADHAELTARFEKRRRKEAERQLTELASKRENT